MFLKELSLKNFRNYSYIQFKPGPLNLIIGGNGEGKTNLLEALALLFWGKSFRPFLTESLIKKEADQTQITAKILKEDRSIDKVSVFLEKSGKKQVFINDKKTSSFFTALNYPLILFSPESLLLLKGGASLRRDWMDRFLISRGEGAAVKEWKKIFQQKSQFLNFQKKQSRLKSQKMLASLNEIFMEKSFALAKARQRALKELNPFFNHIVKFFFGTEQKMQISYFLKGLSLDFSIKNFQDLLEKNFSLELESGRVLYGPHRDDFQLFFNEQPARFFCSQGQLRTLLISLKLAEAKQLFSSKKQIAFLALDDVFSEIDSNIIRNFLDFLKTLPMQIILTAVKAPPALKQNTAFKIFSLKDKRFSA